MTKEGLSNNKLLIVLTPFILYLLLVFNGLTGVDFGEHWDEHCFIRPAGESLQNGSILPHEYIYPSFCYFIAYFSGIFYSWINNVPDARLLYSDYDFYLFVRSIFVLIASLTVIWTYLLSYKITRDYFSSLVSGILICISFEFSYHSRWAVSDCIVVQFAVLSAYILFTDAVRSRKIILCSLVSGLTAGTKYTGGIIILNVLFFIFSGLRFNKAGLLKTLHELVLLTFFSILGFVISTPGIIFESKLVIDGIILQKNVYSGGHLGHTIEPGLEHFTRSFEFISFQLFSDNDIISLIIFFIAITGIIVTLVKKNQKVIYLFLTVFVYIIFISEFKVMIVRNLLLALPFFALAVSIGLSSLSGFFKKFKLQIVINIILAVFFIISGVSVFASSFKIKNKANIDLAGDLNSYVNENNSGKFIYSSRVCDVFKKQNDSAFNTDEYSYFVFFKNEVPPHLYRANMKGQFEKVIGVNDVNIDYYPTWSGNDRILVMKAGKVSKEMLAYTFNCTTEKIYCDAEILEANGIAFVIKEFVNDSILPENKSNLKIELGSVIQENVAFSGLHSVKQDHTNPYGFKCILNLKQGNYYRISVQRKNSGHTGFLIAGENNFYNRSWYSSSEDKRGWELLEIYYFCNDNQTTGLPVYTWQMDKQTSVYFDDLVIETVEATSD